MIEFSLRATHRVRLSQERETWSGGTCVGMRVAFRDDASATGGYLQHQNLNDQQSKDDTPINSSIYRIAGNFRSCKFSYK